MNFFSICFFLLILPFLCQPGDKIVRPKQRKSRSRSTEIVLPSDEMSICFLETMKICKQSVQGSGSFFKILFLNKIPSQIAKRHLMNLITYAKMRIFSLTQIKKKVKKMAKTEARKDLKRILKNGIQLNQKLIKQSQKAMQRKPNSTQLIQLISRLTVQIQIFIREYYPQLKPTQILWWQLEIQNTLLKFYQLRAILYDRIVFDRIPVEQIIKQIVLQLNKLGYYLKTLLSNLQKQTTLEQEAKKQLIQLLNQTITQIQAFKSNVKLTAAQKISKSRQDVTDSPTDQKSQQKGQETVAFTLPRGKGLSSYMSQIMGNKSPLIRGKGKHQKQEKGKIRKKMVVQFQSAQLNEDKNKQQDKNRRQRLETLKKAGNNTGYPPFGKQIFPFESQDILESQYLGYINNQNLMKMQVPVLPAQLQQYFVLALVRFILLLRWLVMVFFMHFQKLSESYFLMLLTGWLVNLKDQIQQLTTQFQEKQGVLKISLFTFMTLPQLNMLIEFITECLSLLSELVKGLLAFLMETINKQIELWKMFVLKVFNLLNALQHKWELLWKEAARLKGQFLFQLFLFKLQKLMLLFIQYVQTQQQTQENYKRMHRLLTIFLGQFQQQKAKLNCFPEITFLKAKIDQLNQSKQARLKQL